MGTCILFLNAPAWFLVNVFVTVMSLCGGRCPASFSLIAHCYDTHDGDQLKTACGVGHYNTITKYSLT
jgi:hypothetical protein